MIHDDGNAMHETTQLGFHTTPSILPTQQRKR